jgi:predicted nucleotide-binding protein
VDLETAKQMLTDGGEIVTSETALPTGTQLRLKSGAIVNVFHTGTCNVQGKNTENAQAILGTPVANVGARGVEQIKSPHKVFVVYGHDATARDQLEVMLRRWELEPLILDQLPSEGATIIEKLERYTAEVHFAVVLATPDDEGHKANHPDEKAFRARQNVVLELGMLLSTLGRSRVAILMRDQSTMERPSDINGLIYIPFKENLQAEVGPTLAREMAQQGYAIDVKRL